MNVEIKQLVRGFVRWFFIVLITLNIILWATIITRCQEAHPKHETLEDVEDTIGFMTATFMSKDDRLIYWRRETKREIKLSSFAYDKRTRFDGKLEGRLCFMYCKTHLFAYLVSQCKE